MARIKNEVREAILAKTTPVVKVVKTKKTKLVEKVFSGIKSNKKK